MLSPVRNAVRRMSPGTILGLLALIVAMSGISIAKIPGDGGKISGCYKKKSGRLRVINADKGRRCRRGERALTWSQQGPAGRDGAAGPTGPAGTPDTADFFTKGESDARFLGSGGTAADASKLAGQEPGAYLLDTETAADSAKLGGFAPSDLVLGTYNANQVNQGGGQRITMGRKIMPASPTGFRTIFGGLRGELQASCDDPARTTIRYVYNAGIGAQDVFIDDGGANPTHTLLGPGGAATAISLTGPGQVERLIFQIGGGQTDVGSPAHVATFIVTAVNAPGGSNECIVQGQAMVQAR